MTSREIAEKYVYGKHTSLTDKQEVEDMVKDIEEYAKAINKNSVIRDVSEPLGFFEFMNDRYYISEIDGSMITGWRLTSVGMKHTLTIHKNNAEEYIESCR